MLKQSISRRGLLQALAVGAGSVAFAGRDSTGAFNSASAKDPAPPARIVIFPMANGVHEFSDIFVDGPAGPNFELGPMTAPLEALGLKGDTVVLDNVEYRRPTQDVDTHFCGLVQCLTGKYSDQNMDSRSKGISLDRYLGQKIGSALAWPQLGMGTMCDSLSYSFAADGTMIPSNTDPLNLYTKIFGNLTSGGPDPALLRRLVRRKSVLDEVTDELAAFKARLPAEDRPRAEAQLAAIQAMEARIATAMKGNPACAKPILPADVDFSISKYVPETMRAFIDLTVAALACDQTRVVLMHSYIREYHPPWATCPWAPVNRPSDDYHGLSHDTAGDNFASFIKAKGFHFQLAGELANKLKAIPEAGKTMLDNTVIFIPSEIGRGHTGAGLQFVTIGGSNLGVKTGQLLRYGTAREPDKGEPTQRLLVSLLNAMGVPDTTFGEDDGTGSGPIAGFLA